MKKGYYFEVQKNSFAELKIKCLTHPNIYFVYLPLFVRLCPLRRVVIRWCIRRAIRLVIVNIWTGRRKSVHSFYSKTFTYCFTFGMFTYIQYTYKYTHTYKQTIKTIDSRVCLALCAPFIGCT